MDIQKISESEMEIMRIIWQHNAPISTGEIKKKLAEGEKKWASTTVLTFLSRLTEKGVVTSQKNGASNIFTANITERQYRNFETKKFIKSVHNGSPKSYVSALFEDDEISREDIEDLKKWFSEL